MPENQSANPLDQLPPLHMPEAISFWPPAIGWWIVALLIIVLAILTTRLLLKQKRKNRLRKAALAELNQHWQVYQSDHDAESYLRATNRLLKQFVMQQYPDDNLHTLSGQQWLNALADLSPQSGVNANTVAALLNLYRKPNSKLKPSDEMIQQTNTLHPLLLKWFKGLRLAS